MAENEGKPRQEPEEDFGTRRLRDLWLFGLHAKVNHWRRDMLPLWGEEDAVAALLAGYDAGTVFVEEAEIAATAWATSRRGA